MSICLVQIQTVVMVLFVSTGNKDTLISSITDTMNEAKSLPMGVFGPNLQNINQCESTSLLNVAFV
jgi:hypothetical protein